MNGIVRLISLLSVAAFLTSASAGEPAFRIREDDKQITIATPHLEAAFRKKGYVSGVAGGSLLDKKADCRDLGFGLDIVDWVMEPGSDEAYRDQLMEWAKLSSAGRRSSRLDR